MLCGLFIIGGIAISQGRIQSFKRGGAECVANRTRSVECAKCGVRVNSHSAKLRPLACSGY